MSPVILVIVLLYFIALSHSLTIFCVPCAVQILLKMLRASCHNSMVLPPLTALASTTSPHRVTDWNSYFTGPSSSDDLASTLVDYANIRSTTSRINLVDYTIHGHADVDSSLSSEPYNAQWWVARPAGLRQHFQLLSLRLMLFLVGYLTFGYAASFGAQLVQRDTQGIIDQPIWVACCVGSLQIALLQSTVLPAMVMAHWQWRRLYLSLCGCGAGILLLFAPRFSSNAGSILYQGLCLGSFLGLFYNGMILQALLNNYDHASGTLASLGGPVGGATLSVALIKNNQTTHWVTGSAIVVLALTCPILLRRMPPASTRRSQDHRIGISKQHRLAVLAFGLASLALYIVPFLLPLVASSICHISSMDRNYLLSSFWMSHAGIRLIASMTKLRLHSAKRWFAFSCFLHVVVHVVWYFAGTLRQLLVVAVLAGATSGCSEGSRTSAVIEILGVRLTKQYRTLLITTMAASTLLGPPAAAALLQLLNSSWGLVVFGMCCSALAGVVIVTVERSPQRLNQPRVQDVPLANPRTTYQRRSYESNEAGPSGMR